ncbi:MAG: PEP-CTERM/exosortase system-associated acyltransferase [Candidatus Binatia bacterium]
MSQPEIFDLGEAFKRYFEIVPAFSDALKDEVYRVRHQVYCEDLNFESVRPDGREYDEYDAYSLHFLLRNVQTNESVGCARLIRPRREDFYYPLPFETTCTDALDRSIVDPRSLPRQSIAEVSRLAVISRYRRRKGEANHAFSISDEDFGTQLLPRFPYIPISLYLATFEMARLNKIDTLFILTEERLARHFLKLGFSLKFIGEPIEHHGQRIPSMMDVNSTINNIRSNLRPLYRVIAADIGKTPSDSRIALDQFAAPA